MIEQPLTRQRVAEALRTVDDPELGISIVDLGLIYGITVTPDNRVKVTMTLTFPGCPLGPTIQRDIEDALIPIGAEDVDVEIVWNPPWSQAMMVDEVKDYRGE